MKAKDLHVYPDMEIRDLIPFLQGILYHEQYLELLNMAKTEEEIKEGDEK